MSEETTGSGPSRSPLLAGVERYDPPRHPAPVDLRLDGNEGAAPSSAALEAIAAAGPELLRRYPSTQGLEARIAGRIGLDPGRVLVTAGADDALERAIRSVLGPGRELLLPVPTFEMIERYAGLTGCEVRPVRWLGGPFPIEEMLGAVSGRTATIAVVTPNSPTGLVVGEEDLRRLATAAPRALLLVDLAYVEFADSDPTAAVLELPNAVVARSMSKAWGLAGARVGWAAGPRELIDWLRAAGHPYAVSGPSLAAAEERLEEEREVRAFVARVREQREPLCELLRELGADPLPSQANFALAGFEDASWVRDALAGLGIAVRAFPGRDDLRDRLRITVPGDPGGWERLEHGLRTALDPEAILFDVDDTLADVGGSYRAATIATAESFGARITPEQITAAKAAGNANNDWELTWRLLEEAGREATLEEVTARFEELYQGAPGRPGLRDRETALVERPTLERLAARVRLGVVTGRPRRDAEQFLREQGIEDLFGAVVTMNDAPLKPDPAPVRLALERLGVERAWLVGDTPDDVRAARSAGVVPLGAIAPADDPAVARRALFAAGAARVLANAGQIEEVIS